MSLGSWLCNLLSIMLRLWQSHMIFLKRSISNKYLEYNTTFPDVKIMDIFLSNLGGRLVTLELGLSLKYLPIIVIYESSAKTKNHVHNREFGIVSIRRYQKIIAIHWRYWLRWLHSFSHYTKLCTCIMYMSVIQEYFSRAKSIESLIHCILSLNLILFSLNFNAFD